MIPEGNPKAQDGSIARSNHSAPDDAEPSAYENGAFPTKAGRPPMRTELGRPCCNFTLEGFGNGLLLDDFSDITLAHPAILLCLCSGIATIVNSW